MLDDELALALLCLAEEPLSLALCRREHFSALVGNPARVLNLLGNRPAQLVDELVEPVPVDAHLAPQRHLLGVADQIVQPIDQFEDVHGRSRRRHGPVMSLCGESEPGTRRTTT